LTAGAVALRFAAVVLGAGAGAVALLVDFSAGPVEANHIGGRLRPLVENKVVITTWDKDSPLVSRWISKISPAGQKVESSMLLSSNRVEAAMRDDFSC